MGKASLNWELCMPTGKIIDVGDTTPFRTHSFHVSQVLGMGIQDLMLFLELFGLACLLVQFISSPLFLHFRMGMYALCHYCNLFFIYY